MGFTRLTLLFAFLNILIGITRCAIFGGSGEPLPLKAHGYKIQAPTTWKPIDRKGTDHAYETATGAKVSVASSCERVSEASLEVLTRHLLMGTRNVKYQKRERVPIGNGEGLYSSVTAKAEGKPLYFELFVLSTHSCVFDFSLIKISAVTETEVAEFFTFFKSFEYGNS